MMIRRFDLMFVEQALKINRNFKLLKALVTDIDLTIWALVDEDSEIITVDVLFKNDNEKIDEPWIGYFDTVFFHNSPIHLFIDAKDAICPDLCMVDDINNLKG